MRPVSIKRPSPEERRAQLLDAAEAVFAEHGVTAPLDLIVAHAQVGRATLYRQFPDRRAIMLALLERSVDKASAAAHTLKDDEQAFFKLLARIADRIAISAPLTDYWRTVERGDEVIEQARNKLWLSFEPAIQQAVARGLCKQALTQKDLSLIFGMLGSSLRGETVQQRKTLARRALHIILEGLKA